MKMFIIKTKKTKFLFLASMFIFSSSASSDTFCNITAGLGISGLTDVSVGQIITTTPQNNASLDFDKTHFGGRFIGECNIFSKQTKRDQSFNIDLGLGTILYGKLSGNVRSTTPLTQAEKNAVAKKLFFPNTNVGILVTPNYYFGNQFVGKLRLGLMYWKNDVQINNETFSDSGSAFHYGLEFGYAVNDELDLSLAWDGTFKNDITANLFTLNASYKFDINFLHPFYKKNSNPTPKNVKKQKDDKQLNPDVPKIIEDAEKQPTNGSL